MHERGISRYLEVYGHAVIIAGPSNGSYYTGQRSLVTGAALSSMSSQVTSTPLTAEAGASNGRYVSVSLCVAREYDDTMLKGKIEERVIRGVSGFSCRPGGPTLRSSTISFIHVRRARHDFELQEHLGLRTFGRIHYQPRGARPSSLSRALGIDRLPDPRCLSVHDGALRDLAQAPRAGPTLGELLDVETARPTHVWIMTRDLTCD